MIDKFEIIAWKTFIFVEIFSNFLFEYQILNEKCLHNMILFGCM